jgi:hypothetical protein
MGVARRWTKVTPRRRPMLVGAGFMTPGTGPLPCASERAADHTREINGGSVRTGQEEIP